MFVFSSLYQLPFGHNKAFLTNSGKLIQTLAGDWNVGGIITLNSGAPFFALAGGDIANTGGPSQRAQRTGLNPYSGPGFRQTPATWINKAAFAVPTLYTYGNEKRNDLVGPSFKNVDFNVSKNFPLLESTQLQFRAEMFNLFNHTNYSTPDNGVQDSQFGQITSAAGFGRQVQFAVKLVF